MRTVLIAVFVSVLVCAVMIFLAVGIMNAGKVNCGVAAQVVDAQGTSLKQWSRGSKERCLFFHLGCEMTCQNWCDKNAKRMAASEKKAAEQSGGTVFNSVCKAEIEGDEDNDTRTVELKGAHIPLR